MKIKDMSVSERPREKMLEKGAAALSDGELLAILLGNGTVEESALEIARRMLVNAGGRLQGLFSMSVGEMTGVRGIGPKKAATIQAAVELGRRFFEEASMEVRAVNTARQAYDIMSPRFRGIDHEECWALYLSKRGTVISRDRICTGSADATAIDTRRIIKTAIDRKAYSMILFHNHPSGNPRPSRADIEHTRILHDACNAVDLKLLDHIIVGAGRYFSFSDSEEVVVGQPSRVGP